MNNKGAMSSTSHTINNYGIFNDEWDIHVRAEEERKYEEALNAVQSRRVFKKLEENGEVTLASISLPDNHEVINSLFEKFQQTTSKVLALLKSNPNGQELPTSIAEIEQQLREIQTRGVLSQIEIEMLPRCMHLQFLLNKWNSNLAFKPLEFVLGNIAGDFVYTSRFSGNGPKNIRVSKALVKDLVDPSKVISLTEEIVELAKICFKQNLEPMLENLAIIFLERFSSNKEFLTAVLKQPCVVGANPLGYAIFNERKNLIFAAFDALSGHPDLFKTVAGEADSLGRGALFWCFGLDSSLEVINYFVTSANGNPDLIEAAKQAAGKANISIDNPVMASLNQHLSASTGTRTEVVGRN